jgi:hypothetical protein
LIAAKYWLGTVSPANETLLVPTRPKAWVPVRESPYRSCTSGPFEENDVCGKSGTVEGQFLQASETTHRSDDPVSV